MYVQVVTFTLGGISEDSYLDTANALAARTAGLPGLLAKLWLENPGANRYGAVYFWDDVESMERFADSDLFEGRVPEFEDLVVEEFGVLENLTAMTQPVLEVVQPRRTGLAAAAAKPPREKLAPAPVGARKRTPPPKKAAPATKAVPVKRAASAKKAIPVEKGPVKKGAATKGPVKMTKATRATKK